MQETHVPSLGREDPLEEGMATHSSILQYSEGSQDRGAWGAMIPRVAKSQTWLKSLSTYTHTRMCHECEHEQDKTPALEEKIF